jgi:hypothetical protein
MRKRYDKDFEEFKLRTTLLPATAGINVLTTFGQLTGPALAQLARAAGGEEGEQGAEGAEGKAASAEALVGLTGAVEALFAKLDEAKVQTWLRACLAGTELVTTTDQGETAQPLTAALDDTFAGRYLLLFAIVRWVFEVNFREVFSSVTIARRGRHQAAVTTA